LQLRVPGSGAESGNPSLQHAAEEDRRVLARENEVENAERREEVNYQSRYDGHHVQTQLLSRDGQVRQLHELTSDQAHYTERRVPATNITRCNGKDR